MAFLAYGLGVASAPLLAAAMAGLAIRLHEWNLAHER